MAEQTHLEFDADIGRTKPVTVTDNHTDCPFCHRELLQGIIAEDGPIVLLQNKYPVLRDTLQLVLIETDDCHSELSLYSHDHLHKVIRMGVRQWQNMIDSGQYASVLFYKNHGPYSGGTIRHPHMQIVGLKHLDYTSRIVPESLHGIIIHRDAGVELNLTDYPQVGFFEFNIRLNDHHAIDALADHIQVVAHYLLNHFHRNCSSYNMFFYYLQGEIIVKIIPRFVTSPLFVGYGIPQVSSRAQAVVEHIRKLYFGNQTEA